MSFFIWEHPTKGHVSLCKKSALKRFQTVLKSPQMKPLDIFNLKNFFCEIFPISNNNLSET